MLPESTSDRHDPHATAAPPNTDPFDTVPGGSPATSRDTAVPRSKDNGTGTASNPPQIGRYEILGEIARGGMGVVYRAFDRQLDRTVALKLIKSGELADEDDIERFQTEAKAAAQLDHPGIVPVYEVGEFGGQHYMAMAFIDGHSLWQEVKESPLAPKLAAKLMQQVAEAIQFAHHRGIVHRDLKPQNILLTKDGVPKVTDFGLAKRREQDGSLTQTGQALGTPSYMPPEQAQGKIKDIGPLADVYSLGATLYCLLTGRPPFQAATQLETMLQVVEQEPVSPKSLNRAVSLDLETICLKCLEKDPAKRYESAEALAKDLGRYLIGEPIQARRVGQVERAWRWCRRNPLISGLISTAALLLIAVTGISVLAYYRESGLVGDLEAKTEELSVELYKSQLTQASASLQVHDHRAAAQALADVPWNRRGFEYYLLWRQCEGTPQTLRGHHGKVHSLSYNPVGTQLASASDDYTVKLWNLQSGTEFLTFQKHRGAVIWLKYSPDGSHILSSSVPGLIDLSTKESILPVLLWNASSGDVVRTFDDQLSKSQCSFSPDGSRLATAGGDHSIKIWDVKTGHEIQTLPGHPAAVACLAYSPKGMHLASAYGDGTIKLWNALTGAPIRSWQGHSNSLRSIKFRRDGEHLVGADVDGLAKTWIIADGSEIFVFDCHGTDLEYTPDGLRLIGNGRYSVWIWDAATGKENHELRAPGLRVNAESFALSADSAYVAIAYDDHSVIVFDTWSGQSFVTLRGHSGPVTSVCFNSTTSRLATGAADSSIKIWNVSPQESLPTVFKHHDIVSSVDFGPTQDQVVWGSLSFPEMSQASLRSLAQNRSRNEPGSHSAGIADLRFSPDRKLLATASRDKTVKLWDVETGRVAKTLEGHADEVTALSFSPDGRRLSSSSSDQTARIWDVATGTELQKLSGHAAKVSAITYDPQGRWVVTASLDGTVKLWDADSGVELRMLCGHASGVTSLAFSPDGRHLASGSLDDTVIIWNPSTGEGLVVLDGHTGDITSLSFHPEGKRIASASADKTVKIWDIESTTELLTLRGHTEVVLCVRFSLDGARIASASADQKVQVWDTSTGAEIFALKEHQSPVTSFSFNRNATRLITQDASKRTAVWQIPEGKLLVKEKIPPASELTARCPDPRLGIVIHGRGVQLIRQTQKSDSAAEN